MKTLLKVCAVVVLVVAALAIGGISWLALRKPAQRPPSAERVEITPERVARGKYLVHHVSDCVNCHSGHTLAFGLPLQPGTEGQGGMPFGPEFGVPGVVTAQNITPDPETGLGKWTDGEILRAMREGVDRNGEALFPMMPYRHLRTMSDDDAKAIVAYLRTLKPIRNQTPPKKINFPVNYFVKFVPQPLEGPVAAPDRSNSVAYGKYLSIVGGCIDCHTPHDEKGRPVAGREYTGGWEMRGPWGRNITANLTPHPDTYVGRATKAEFIGRFHAFRGIDASNAPAAAKGRNTIMPWLSFSGMTDEDLGAIYDFLKTLPPVENKVNTFPDAVM